MLWDQCNYTSSLTPGSSSLKDECCNAITLGKREAQSTPLFLRDQVRDLYRILKFSVELNNVSALKPCAVVWMCYSGCGSKVTGQDNWQLVWGKGALLSRHVLNITGRNYWGMFSHHHECQQYSCSIVTNHRATSHLGKIHRDCFFPAVPPAPRSIASAYMKHLGQV